MFTQRRNRNMVEAAFTTLALIYHVTVNNLRKGQRNAVVGLMMTVVQAVAMILGFYLVYFIIGVRYSPIRGNFIVYIMTGIFMFMTHNQGIQAVMSAEGPVSPLMKHTPMNTAIVGRISSGDDMGRTVPAPVPISTSAISRVRGIGGSESRNTRP